MQLKALVFFEFKRFKLISKREKLFWRQGMKNVFAS